MSMIVFARSGFAAHVYPSSDLDAHIKELAATDATGWAIAVAKTYVRDVDLWVTTQLSNGMLDIEPKSDALAKTLLRVGQTPDGHLAVKFTERIPEDDLIGVWEIEGSTSDWKFDAEVIMGDSEPTGNVKRVEFDLGRDEIRLDSEMLPRFKATFPTTTVNEKTERLMMPCSELAEKNGVALTFMVGRIPIEIRKVDELSDEGSDMCATNLRFGLILNTIGRSFLNQYDVLLDAQNRKLHVLSKRSFYPKTPLMKYRMDPGFNGLTLTAWRWTLSPGPVRKEDFVITYIDSIFPQSFEVICFSDLSGNSLLPSSKESWVGAPVVDIDADGITVSENMGWERYVLQNTGKFQVSRIDFRNLGFRMKKDWVDSIEGERLVLRPVRGYKMDDEFTVPVASPVVENGIRIRSIGRWELDDLLQMGRRWLGTPRFQVLDDKKIIITADKDDSECDREVQFIRPTHFDMMFDFSVQICKYRQVHLGAPGYAFAPLDRSSALMSELQFKIKGTEVVSISDADSVRFYTSAPRGAERWSPGHLWTADPVATLDPATRRITITPSGAGGWEYWHEWTILDLKAAFLEFKPLAKRLTATGKFSLTDDFWEFVPVTPDSTGPQFTIKKGSFMRKEADGSVILLFEDVSGPVFDGPLEGTFEGIPTVAVLDSGALVVQSKEGFKPHFNVVASNPTPESLQIRFTPTEYTRFGSIAVKAGTVDEICGICHDELDPEAIVAKTKCRHYYHISCLRRIEQRVCPYCRTSLDL